MSDVLFTADAVVAGRGSFRTAPATFVLRRGDTVAIIGASGAGKTSMLRTLAGVAAPWSGRVDALGARAMCFQEPRLLPWRSVAENAAFGRGRRPDDQFRRRVHHHLDALGIGALAHRRVADLSGGQRRRVAIARTLAVGASVVLVDEPFTQLDEHSSSLVESALAAHACAGGAVIVGVHALVGARHLTDSAIPVGATTS
ncbi:MAG: ATP-binding cassette domain-containing protein [Actinomycetota bacterium]